MPFHGDMSNTLHSSGCLWNVDITRCCSKTALWRIKRQRDCGVGNGYSTSKAKVCLCRLGWSRQRTGLYTRRSISKSCGFFWFGECPPLQIIPNFQIPMLFFCSAQKAAHSHGRAKAHLSNAAMLPRTTKENVLSSVAVVSLFSSPQS